MHRSPLPELPGTVIDRQYEFLVRSNRSKLLSCQDDTVAKAVAVAGAMEHHRMLPSVQVCGDLGIGAFAYYAAQLLRYGKIKHTVSQLDPPSSMYQSVSLPPNSVVPWSQDQYLTAFIDPLLQHVSKTGSLPATLVVQLTPNPNTAEPVRFVDMVYYLAHLLRHRHFAGKLPSFLNKYVISPIGMVPWDVPSIFFDHGYGTVLVSGQTAESVQVSIDDIYYYSEYPSHRMDVFLYASLVRGWASDPDNPLDVAKTVLAHVSVESPYYLGGAQFGSNETQWDHLRFFRRQSSGPNKFAKLLLSSLGFVVTTDHTLPVPAGEVVGGKDWTIYFPLDAPYLAGTDYPTDCAGWSDFDVHGTTFGSIIERFGVCPEFPPNGQVLAPVPTEGDSITTAVGSYTTWAEPTLDVSNVTTGVVVNALDVATYGPKTIVSWAKKGGLRAIVLNVKDMDGWLYYTTPGLKSHYSLKERVHPLLHTTLGALLDAAQGTNIECWASFSVLADEKTWKTSPGWRMALNQIDINGVHLPHFISPCVSYNRELLQIMVAALAKYPITGIIFTGLYYPNVWGEPTPESPNVPGDSTWVSTLEAEHFCPEYPWTPYLALQETLKALIGKLKTAPGLQTAVASLPLGKEASWPGYKVSSWDDVWKYTTHVGILPFYRPRRLGYQWLPAIQDLVDHVVLTCGDSHWIRQKEPFWTKMLEDYVNLTGKSAYLSVPLKDEWIFSPSFHLGLRNRAVAAGAKGVLFHSPASIRAGTAPALTRSGWELVANGGF